MAIEYRCDRPGCGKLSGDYQRRINSVLALPGGDLCIDCYESLAKWWYAKNGSSE